MPVKISEVGIAKPNDKPPQAEPKLEKHGSRDPQDQRIESTTSYPTDARHRIHQINGQQQLQPTADASHQARLTIRGSVK
jgi:hypothetical protein